MRKSVIAVGALYCLTVSLPACFADETVSSTVKSSTSGGTCASTKSTSVGPLGASSSSERSSIGTDGAGGVTAIKHKESHKIGVGGSSDSVSHSATTLAPDGSTTVIKKESETVAP